MMKYIKSIFSLCLLILFSLTVRGGRSDESGDSFLQVECKDKVWAGELVTYAVYLYTSSPYVGNLALVAAPDFSGFSVMTGQTPSKPERVKVKGKEYNRWLIDLCYLSTETPGTYKVSAPEYVVAIGEEVRYNDPFWGPRSEVSYHRVRLGAQACSLKVRALPAAPAGFTGAVGDFSVKVSVPPGKIIKGFDAYAVVKVEGFGVIPDSKVPDIPGAFSSGGKFKSASPSVGFMQRGDAPYCTMTLDCTFTPVDDQGELGPVKFVYFNPSTGKYVTAKSPVVNWQTSETSSDSRPPEVMDV